MGKEIFNFKKENIKEEDFDMTIIWNTFLRNKKSILLVTFVSGLLSVIYSFNIKPIWIGSFEVVVRKENDITEKNIKSKNDITSFIKGESLYDSKTQALILKSPSVLLPVYEFVQKEYLKRGIKREEISYSSWFKTYLDIKFTDGSKVLSIKYKDNDKDLILNTLEQISNKYKEYSKRDRLKSIANTIKYLKEQKEVMKKKSFNSLKNLNNFALENGIGNIDGFSSIDKDNNLNKLDSSDINKRYQSQINALENYELNYLELSTNLNENSELIKSLKRRIAKIKESLKRPGQILIDYKNLQRIANRDLVLLEGVDNNLEIAKLEQARIPDVWELISVPTIEDNKYFPNKKLFLLAGLTIAFGSSLSACLIKEKLEGYLYDKNLIDKLIQTNLIDSLNLKNTELNNNFVNNIFSKLKTKNNIIINFTSTKFNKDDLFLNSQNFKFEEESLNNAENILIMIEEGKAKYDDFLLINKYILLNKEKIIGWIFIEV